MKFSSVFLHILLGSISADLWNQPSFAGEEGGAKGRQTASDWQVAGRLVLGVCKMSRFLDAVARILEVYMESFTWAEACASSDALKT